MYIAVCNDFIPGCHVIPKKPGLVAVPLGTTGLDSDYFLNISNLFVHIKGGGRGIGYYIIFLQGGTKGDQVV